MYLMKRVCLCSIDCSVLALQCCFYYFITNVTEMVLNVTCKAACAAARLYIGTVDGGAAVLRNDSAVDVVSNHSWI